MDLDIANLVTPLTTTFPKEEVCASLVSTKNLAYRRDNKSDLQAKRSTDISIDKDVEATPGETLPLKDPNEETTTLRVILEGMKRRLHQQAAFERSLIFPHEDVPLRLGLVYQAIHDLPFLRTPEGPQWRSLSRVYDSLKRVQDSLEKERGDNNIRRDIYRAHTLAYRIAWCQAATNGAWGSLYQPPLPEVPQ